MLSALVMPGLGQFAQKRWIASLLYGCGFFVAFVAALAFGVRILTAYYAFGLSLESKAEPPNLKPDVIGLMASFTIAIVIYVAGVLDAYLAGRRAAAVIAAVKREDRVARITGTNRESSLPGG
jgi:hypothetical protein